MVSLLEGSDVIHSVGFTLAHVPIYQRAKEVLEKKPLGKLFRFNVAIYISQVFGKKKGWLFDRSVQLFLVFFARKLTGRTRELLQSQ